jgi:hypothetical protein
MKHEFDLFDALEFPMTILLLGAMAYFGFQIARGLWPR